MKTRPTYGAMIPLSSLAGMIDTAPTEERARMSAADYARLKAMTPREIAVAGKVVEQLMTDGQAVDIADEIPDWRRQATVQAYAAEVMRESGWEILRSTSGWRKMEGAKQPRKLTDDQIRDIRDRSRSARDASVAHDVSVDLVYRIRRGELYADVADDPPGQ